MVMPDEVNPINTLSEAIALMNAAIERAKRAEARVNELAAENLILKGQLCQCRQDVEFPELGPD